MSSTLTGRHALVCGASQGIGRATAIALAGLGAQVTVLARSRDKLEALLPELEHEGAPKAHALVADLDDRDALLASVRSHLEQHGPIHIWVNNTGGPKGGPLAQAQPADLAHAFGRHLLAPQTLLPALLPGMAEAGYGRIVNVLSTSVREPIPNLGVSNVVRAAVAAWAKTLSRELPSGVTINNVLPGFTDTPRLASIAGNKATKMGISQDDAYAGMVAQVPEGRLGRPEELAAVIAFLCSPSAAYIRGTTLPVDGGRLRSI